MNTEDLKQYIDKYCSLAEEYAKSSKFNLDYSDNSIVHVEILLDRYSKSLHRRFFKKKLTESQINALANIWGVYVGEVMRRKLGAQCEWAMEDVNNIGEVLHLLVGEARAFPITKVYKRLKNGPSDSIKSFYDIGLVKLLESNW